MPTNQKPKVTTRTGNRPVQVTWLDHSSFEENTWHEVSQTVSDLTPLEVTTVGWIIHETKDYIVLAGTFTENNHTNGEMCIIKKCILTRKKL